jgi:hypothetical protein
MGGMVTLLDRISLPEFLQHKSERERVLLGNDTQL